MDKHKNEQQELYDSFYLRQNELAQKSITLQVLYDHMKVTKELCEGRTILLGKEIKDLDEIHSKVWELQNRICNQVWDFSIKHDLNEIVRNYPNLPSEFNVLCECERDSDVVTHAEENVEIEKLILEIQNLESKLQNTKCDYLGKQLILAEKELQMYEIENPENESLKTEIRACEEQNFSLRSKIGAEHKRIENNTNISLEYLKNSNISIKTNSSNLNKINTLANARLSSALQTNLDASKENYNLSKSSIPNRGGFVRASTYLSTITNPIPFQNTSSYKKIATEVVPTEKLSTNTNHPKKKFVLKTKSGLAQRR